MSIKSLIKNILRFRKEKIILPILHPISENNLLEGKIIFISGGSGGIGLAIAKSCIEAGGKVIIAGTSESKLNTLVKEMPSNFSTQIKIFVLDFSKHFDFDEKISQAVQLFGKIDVIVNSVGVHTDNVDFWSMTPTEYDRILNINLRAPYFLCLAFSKYMKSQKIKGHILLISSNRGSEPAWSPYGLSKWGLNGMVRGLAQKLIPYGISVNAIAPGSTATSLIGVDEGDSIYSTENQMGRLIMPDEVATYARLMISDLGGVMTGEIVHLSAGRGIFDIR